MSLLEQAKKKVPIRDSGKEKKFSDEEIELAFAYVNREITTAQASKVLKIHPSNFPAFLANCLVYHLRKNGNANSK